MIDVKGRWAFITGAARGLGYRAAITLAGQGCNLILHARTKEHLKDVVFACRNLEVDVKPVSAELSDISQVEDMLREIDAMGVAVDIVLNNAGVQVAYRTDYLDTPVQDYTRSFLVNTISPMMITYHFLKKMDERGFGRIVNTTSGIRLEPEQAGYSASKAALDKVTMDLASKYEGTDIIISLTDPGWCRTDLGGDQAPNSPESALPGIVVGAFVDDRRSGRCFGAQDFTGMSLEAAVEAAKDYPVFTGTVAF